MGKKNRKSHKPCKPSSGDFDPQAEDSVAFAQSLLSNMDLNSKDSANASVADESTIEETEEKAADFGARHPHLFSIHRGLTKVFKLDHSKSDSDSSSAAVSRSGSEYPSQKGVSHSFAGASSSAKDRDSQASPPSSRVEKLLQSKIEEANDVEADNTANSAVPVKKRNRRKEKLAERERERARIVREAQAEAETDVDKRAIELKGMCLMITKAGLAEHESQPDGHCLFHSLSDQLLVRRQIEVSVPELRKNLANYIREHPDDFVPYLIEGETGDVVNIEKYTADLESTPLWGGDLEIMAASCLYETPIRVHFGSQAPLNINEEKFTNVDPLHLAFYQAKFGLGAHYNSLRDKESTSGNSEAQEFYSS